MNRRTFLSASAASLALADAAAVRLKAETADVHAGRPFKLNYAPHFGMFRSSAGANLVDQLKFAADHGFRAWEDNGMKDRPAAAQQRIASAMQRLNMRMGVISALRGTWNAINFAGGDQAAREEVLAAMRAIVEVAKRVNGQLITVVCGMENPRMPKGYQSASCIELLKQCCDIVEPHGLVMAVEPLNRRTNHPGVFVHRASQAYALCRAVSRPSCKLLFDVYHQQIDEGNLIPNVDRCWDEIAYFQAADNPGRNEPGTGEINYANFFRHIHDKGYRGVVGMEHGNARNGAEGEMAVIDAYRRVDPH